MSGGRMSGGRMSGGRMSGGRLSGGLMSAHRHATVGQCSIHVCVLFVFECAISPFACSHHCVNIILLAYLSLCSTLHN